ncbi:ATP-binding protein [Dactylosporangium siamense]|nr:ATP-binding protein [Dactylosporangium siamense]
MGVGDRYPADVPGLGVGGAASPAEPVRRALAALAESAAVQARAGAAVAAAVDTMSAIAARHGHRLRGRGAVQDAAARSVAAGQSVSRVFTAGGVRRVRQLVAHVGREAGLVERLLPGFVLAVQELLTNAVRHGGGWGRIRLYRDGDVLVCVVTDHGPGFAGDLKRFGGLPPVDSEGGRGLLLARQIADSFHIGTGPAGATITVTMNLPPGTEV